MERIDPGVDLRGLVRRAPVADAPSRDVAVEVAETAFLALRRLLRAGPLPPALCAMEDGAPIGVIASHELVLAGLGAVEAAAACAEQAHRDVMASLSDDARSSVTALRAAAELLTRRGLPADVRAGVAAIAAHAERLDHLLDDVVVLGAGEPLATGARTAVCPLDALNAASRPWTDDAGLAAAPLLVHVSGPADLRLHADAARVTRLLGLILRTSLADSGVEPVEAALALSSHDRVGTMRLTLRGRRIQAAGHGPEMALAARLAAAAGADLRRHAEGAALTLTLTAPVVDASAAVAPASAEAEPPAARKPRVLIVDDNATNRLVATALCEMFGCASTSVEDGLQAVEAMATLPCDLVLMDIKMPRMNGIEATRAIRAMPGAAAVTPIVALTANAADDDVARYLASGMNDVVEKPIKPERLLMALRNALQGQEPYAVIHGDGEATAA